MREIKFRGRTYENEWAYGSLIDVGSKKFIWNRYPIEVDPESVGQLLSLKDKNGKEIYEGDILKIGWAGSFYIGVVEYDSKSACYMLKSNDKFTSLNTFTLSPAAWIEVIGNIYENPELLEVSKND